MKVFFLIIGLLFLTESCKKKGCIDPAADNYNSKATVNTSCNYQYNITFRIQKNFVDHLLDSLGINDYELRFETYGTFHEKPEASGSNDFNYYNSYMFCNEEYSNDSAVVLSFEKLITNKNEPNLDVKYRFHIHNLISNTVFNIVDDTVNVCPAICQSVEVKLKQ